jgi:small subunit ribosomal protein S9
MPKKKVTKKKKGAVAKKPIPTKIFWATGKRKRAIAVVRYSVAGKGDFVINKKSLEKYFPYFEFQRIAASPLKLVGLEQKGNIIIKIKGGGIKSQAESIRLGISRALIKYSKDYRKVLKKAGFLTRDARIKERKKFGLKRARRGPQWSKR